MLLEIFEFFSNLVPICLQKFPHSLNFYLHRYKVKRSDIFICVIFCAGRSVGLTVIDRYTLKWPQNVGINFSFSESPFGFCSKSISLTYCIL